MSSALRHISQGIAGFTGAPRPALGMSTGGGSVREHDINMAMTSAASARPTLTDISSTWWLMIGGCAIYVEAVHLRASRYGRQAVAWTASP